MTPAIILDVLIAALLIAAALRGCWRGLFLSLSGILVLIVAMIGANLGAKALTQPVSDWVTPKIEERIAGTVEKTLEKKGQESGQTLEELLPDSLKGLLDRTGLLDPLRGTLERRAEDSVAATAKAIAAAVARELVETFAYAILYILIFVALVILLRLAALALLIVALARPQDVERLSRTNTEGIDIMLAIDVSGSMLARDFRPDRITAAKEVAGSFIADRYGDRIGLVAFAGEAFTQSPLTTDQGTLQTLLARIRSGLIEDGTAIGNGLATAVNRLRESEAKSKVIILLTDGVNNRGEIAPLTAAEIAKAQGIRVYTIGVGTEGMAPYPAVDIYGTPTGGTVMAKVEIDEKTLRSIAEQTGGQYFRATDKAKLKAIYDQINQLEKSKVEVTEHVTYHEQFLLWVLAGLGLLVLEFLFSNLVLKRIP